MNNEHFEASVLSEIFLFFSLDDQIWGYDPLICRSMGVSYANWKTTYNGITAYVFELDISEDINVKQCFCRDEDTCPPHGSFDLYRCTGMKWLVKYSERYSI